MIQANDLRLGNYLSHKGTIYQVWAIGNNSTPSGESFYVSLDSEKEDKHLKGIDISEIGAVEISEEKLLKCGFLKTIVHEWLYELPETPFQVAIRNGEDGKFMFRIIGLTICKVDYLHELQNLIYDISKKELSFTP